MSDKNVLEEYDDLKDAIDKGLDKLSRAKGRLEELLDSFKNMDSSSEDAEDEIKKLSKELEKIEQKETETLLEADDIVTNLKVQGLL